MNLQSLKQKLPSSKKAWLILLTVIIAGALLWVWLTPKAAGTYMTRPLSVGTLSVEVSANGTLAPVSTVSIGSELSGIVSKVYVDVNDEVKAGDVLIELDTQKLKAQVRQSKAALGIAKAKLGEAEVDLREIQAKYDRMAKLNKQTKGQAPSKLEMDEQKAKVDRAKAALVSAQASVEDAQAALETKETDLSKAFIKSPIDGMVLARSVEPGYAVAASLQAVELLEIASDVSKLELQISVDEADVSAVKMGQKASFTVSAYPNKDFPATLKKVSFGSTTTSNVVTYTTYLEVENKELLLRPGMTATARIETQHRDQALLISNMALRFTPKNQTSKSAVDSFMMRPGSSGVSKVAKETSNVGAGRQRTVYVLEHGSPKAVSITIGSSDGVFTEVLSDNLKAGDQVIVGQSAAK